MRRNIRRSLGVFLLLTKKCELSGVLKYKICQEVFTSIPFFFQAMEGLKVSPPMKLGGLCHVFWLMKSEQKCYVSTRAGNGKSLSALSGVPLL